MVICWICKSSEKWCGCGVEGDLSKGNHGEANVSQSYRYSVPVVVVFRGEIVFRMPEMFGGDAMLSGTDGTGSKGEAELASSRLDLVLPIVSLLLRYSRTLTTYLVVFLDEITVHDHVISVLQNKSDNWRAVRISGLVVSGEELLLLYVVCRFAEGAGFDVEDHTLLPEFGPFTHRLLRIIGVNVVVLHMLGLVVFILEAPGHLSVSSQGQRDNNRTNPLFAIIMILHILD